MTVTLDNEKRSALSLKVMVELQGALAAIAKTDSKVIIIRSGSAPSVFCSGHDLAEVGRRENLKDLFAKCTDLMTTIREVPQVVIAEVDGLATAAGCQLIASCGKVVKKDFCWMFS